MGLRPETRLAVAAFAVAVAYLPGVASPAYMPRWWAAAVLIPVISSMDPRRVQSGAGLALLAGLLWAAATLLWAPIPAVGAMQLYFMVILALVLVAAANVDDVEPAVEAFGWGIAVSSGLAMAQWFGVPLPGLPGNGPAGLFFNTEILAETAAPVVVWALWRRRWALALALMPAIALTGSRIAPVVILAGLWWGLSARRPLKAWLLLGGGAVAVSLLLVIGPEKALSGFTRLVLWGAAVLSITPLGRGLGWWAVAHPGPMEEFAHSDALQILVELGAGGAALLAVPVLAFWKGGGSNAVRCAFAAACLEALVSFPLQLPASGFLAALLAGGMVGLGSRVRVTELAGRAPVLFDDGWKAALRTVVVRQLTESPGHLSLRASPAVAGRGNPSRGRAAREGRTSRNAAAWGLMGIAKP